MSLSHQPEVVTLGCRLNIAESAAIRQMAGRGQVVVNGCGVTNQAVKDTRAAIRRLRRARPDAELIVTGCASEMDRDAFAAMPEVDRVIGNAAKLLPATWGARPNAPRPVPQTRAFVGVQNGCDHHCTFCAIPQGRGRNRAEPIADVIPRVAALVESGQREVVLSGVDLASYDDRGARLGALVERLLTAVPRLERLRLSSLDPAAIDDRLFALLTQEPRVMPHVHLSVQAGDDMILKRMRRRHARVDVLRLVERLKAARDVAIGADLIAGFPTEDAAMFANTLALVDDADIAHAHVFPYSPRTGTPAARMPQVTPAVARDRAVALRAASARRLAARLSAQVGTVQRVLVEKPGDRGHAPDFAAVRLAFPAPVGSVVAVTVTAAAPDHLTGHIA
ncbi:threonylcarbamoyladenosine tRNA methylthiotransferase MtaB [Sphingomonas sp. BE138]|uniref:MiaB/RimO family radical SAM methylthiotransferase n=1 Tax=Sphingomonas sp. BE138 TaxID=2817845 RepID=UPI002865D5ED|nr:MiaB/RimO family radical SAM methylthiotransferase [Sphingomonas sp. BE138]MDR6787768.1 threonylcarbamoyladenosine tRNA methylthiotransferase MtaB [Sphingomonas sp. BE138]